MRRAVIILIVLAVIVGGSLVVYQVTAREKEPPAPDYETIDVERGTIVSTVSATGAIEPADEVSLGFRSVGRVAEVLVTEGQPVAAGDVLARLNADELALSQAQSEVQVAITQAQLAKLQSGPSEIDVQTAEANVSSAAASVESAQAALASAQAGLASAEAAYDDLVAGPSADERQAAAATLERARILRDQAQSAYDQVAYLPNIGQLPQSLQLQQATVDYNVAAANYRLTVARARPSQIAAGQAQIEQAKAAVSQAEAGIAQAQAALAQAEATRERLFQGPTAEDLTIAEAQVTQAQLALQQARLAGEGSTLTSPIEGVVSRLNVKRGEVPNAALPAAIVTDISSFHIDIDVDEIDITRLQEGQAVAVTLDALPDAELTGHVAFISPTPLSSGGVVSYLVRIVIDQSDTPLRSGLSATTTITTEAKEGVLVVPNRAIQIDRTSGRTYVDKLVNGIPTRTEIVIGSRNERLSEVVSGLDAGDKLAIRSGGALEGFFGF